MYVAQFTYMEIMSKKNRIQKSGMPRLDFEDVLYVF